MLAFFLGGITGGFTHCLSMCGKFAVCGRACSGKSCGGVGVGFGFNWPHHAGRLVTYGGLGFMAALLAKQIAAFTWWPVISSLLLATAGVLFLLSCINDCRHLPASNATSNGVFMRGALLGFMPCGLLYAALMMAAALGDPLKGLLAMWLFVLGTLPALLFAEGLAGMLERKWSVAARSVRRALLAFNGVWLLAMAAHNVDLIITR